jgi:DNA-directed RNA polymerase subunit RPC12/RpoP
MKNKIPQLADSIVVACHRCKEEWTLNPKKWRNFDTANKIGKKRIICPYCNNKMLLNKQQTKDLLKFAPKRVRASKKQMNKTGKTRKKRRETL